IPVPAGISFPMITFSLRPSRLSLLPWIAASVRTFVVSWKDAADSHDSLADEVQLHLARAHDPQHLVRVHRTLGELLADLDVGAVLDPEPRPARQLVVDDLVGAVVRGDRELAELLAVLDADGTGQLRDRGLALGDAGLEQLHHTRQTVTSETPASTSWLISTSPRSEPAWAISVPSSAVTSAARARA